MTRRIILAIVAVTALAEVLFAVPLALTIQHRLGDQDRLELTQVAALAASRVADNRLVLTSLPRPERDQQLGLYDTAGHLIDGKGPPTLESPASQALTDRVVDTREDGWLVVTVPRVVGGTVQGLVRSAEPLSAGASRVRVVWLQLAALAAAALVLSAIAAAALGRRLTRPLENLGRDAARIGEGDFTITAARTGLPEIDSVGLNLSRTAERVSSLFAREQAFTADASHQLRSPVTGLRLTLEAELAHPRPDHRDALSQALSDVERLETTIEDLLDLARDTAAERAPVDLTQVLDALERRWHASFAGVGRRLTVDPGDDVAPPTVSAAALSHVLDVLVDNARRHGAGDVGVRARGLRGAVSVSVTDQGPGIADPSTVFQRRHSAGGGTGIGLALARRLTEAEGGRLRLRGAADGTTFEVTLPAAGALHDAGDASVTQ
ncbi:MAG: HAMP domain-containing histidine kinase [Actinomycetota bacterium]|nr:HAMP domain-containing histidine kinase [Actinomycetota bacterium]